MYIRWKIKPRTEQKYGYDENHRWRRLQRVHATLLCAYLVESKRINGKSRQKTTHLACIQDKHIESLSRRLDFWQSAQKHIAPLNLTAEQSAMVETKLLERVPDVTREQIEEEKRESAKRVAELRAMMKGRM